jgi:Zn-dependent protease with chaperone function
MSAQTDLFQAGAAAIQQQRYPDAVRSLEAFCQSHANTSSKDYFQAKVWLVKAYQSTGQLSQAIALCQQLIATAPPQLQAWAQKSLSALMQAEQLQAQAPENTSSSSASAPTPSVSGSSSAFPTQPSAPSLTPEAANDLLKQGNKALKMNRFADAVEALEAYCQGADPTHADYPQAQTFLVKAYKGNGQTEVAIALCRHLMNHEKPFIKIWADKYILQLNPTFNPHATSEATSTTQEAASASGFPVNEASSVAAKEIPKAGRSAKDWVKLTMKGVTGNLFLASGITLSLLFGMVMVLALSLLLIQDSQNPTLGLMIAIVITILFNGIVFLVAPFIMDIVQRLLYGTQWVSLSQIERQSPEAARVIRTVCQKKKIQQPRLGIINDQNPTAFTYGSFPNSARLVVSQGLFTYLEDEEVATVYAHELGHIVHWDFALMTLAATLVQITYLSYVYTREMANKLGDNDIAKKIKSAAQTTALMAYVFYIAGEYLVLYLSRTREYYADHFAAEVTGNPNALSRALIKIAYGILEEGQRDPNPSKVLQGTRALGISDPRAAALTGTAYRVASEPQKVGKVFLWDMFNPWAWWMELSSTHPLTGKRVRALSTYAEQLGLATEFDMARVVKEGRRLSKQRLYGNFVLDLLLFGADLLGAAIAIGIGIGLLSMGYANGIAVITLALFGFGVGTLFKTLVMYPGIPRIPVTDVLTLLSDPYASPLRGRLVKLNGQVIGRGDPGNRFGSDFKMQDPTGMIFLRYSSRFGPLGNFLFGMTQADSFVYQQVASVGWFRRGMMPWVDLMRMDCEQKWTVHSYHRFWSLVLGFGTIILSFVLPMMLVSSLS